MLLRRRRGRPGSSFPFAGFMIVAFLAIQPGDGVHAENGAPSEATVLPVPVTPVTWVRQIDTTRTYTGRIETRRSSRLSFAVRGRLDAVLLREGERASKGDVLARLQTKRYEAQLLKAEADLARARAQLAEMEAGPRKETIASTRAVVEELKVQVDLARLKAERRAELLESNTISSEEYDEALLALRSFEARLASSVEQLAELEAGTRSEQIDAQRATVAALEAAAKLARIDLADTAIVAPYDGAIVSRLVDEGTVLDAGQPVIEFLESGALQARVGVPSGPASRLKPGMKLMLATGSGEVEGVVSALLPELTMETRTVPVLLDLPAGAAESGLRAGEIVRLALTEAMDLEGVWVPTTALVKGIRGLWACNVLRDDVEDDVVAGFVERREVELIHTEGDRALVRGPLEEGEWIVTSGNHRIVEGQQVRAAGSES